MPQTIDLLNFPCGEDVAHWPKLTCTEPGQLALQDAGLHLPDSRAIRFADNGQIRSFDDTHRLVFDRAGGLLELHEAGAIRLLTGSPTPTERLRLLATGQVGIGTATPTQPLEVVGTVKATNFQGSGAELTGVRGTDDTRVAKEGDTMSGPLVITAPGTGLRITHHAAVAGTLTVGSHLGIGTTNPLRALQIGASINAAFTFEPADASPNAGYIRFGDNTGWKLHFGRSRESGIVTGAPLNTGTTGVLMTLQDNGNVGIGTITPILGLDVRGGAQGWIGSGDSSQSIGGWRLGRWPDYPTANTWVYLSRADRIAYQDLAVGALWAGGGLRFGTADDLAEMTPVKPADRLEPGDVVIIDEPADDRVLLTKSHTPYDVKVAGVISDPLQAGLVIGGSHPADMMGDDIKPVALIGRVLTKVTTANGGIKAGDLLTTSATAGYAMKASKPGPILGKAMQSFHAKQDGVTTGKIWMHVNLGWYGTLDNKG